MAKLSNAIEIFINELLDEADGALEIQRSFIAAHFDCSPSQINYVLTTRFTPFKGYFVESRRGGGGFIRIFKKEINDYEKIFDMCRDFIGNSITKDNSDSLIEELYQREILTKREVDIIKASISTRALGRSENKNYIRADILKNILLMIL